MTGIEALVLIKNGIKIRRNWWGNGIYIYAKYDKEYEDYSIYNEDGSIGNLNANIFLLDDWEIFE